MKHPGKIYLQNITRSIDSNLRWLDEHPQVSKRQLLEEVIDHAKKRLAAMEPED
jgi:hypothetical protein